MGWCRDGYMVVLNFLVHRNKPNCELKGDFLFMSNCRAEVPSDKSEAKQSILRLCASRLLDKLKLMNRITVNQSSRMALPDPLAIIWLLLL